jgi:hypothetical protein
LISDNIYLLYLDLDGVVHQSDNYEKLESELQEAFLKKEWIHIELRLGSSWNFEGDYDLMTKSLSTKFGIHVVKEENNLEDIKFTNPYRKRKSDEYLNTSISQFHDSLQKK